MHKATANSAGALLLATLVTALVALVAGAFTRAYPLWQPVYLVAACFGVAVESALVRYRMREGRHLQSGALAYLAAEAFALVALMRVVASLGLGAAALPTASQWLRDPLAALDTPFVACLLAGSACAAAVRLGLGELDLLATPLGPAHTEHALDAAFYRARAETDEQGAVARLAAGIAWGGVTALGALAIQLADLSGLGRGPGGLPPAMGLAGIIYLACGALLYSRARLGLLRARWLRDETAVEPQVPGRWRWQSAAVVLGVATLGLLLPRSYGAGLVEAARGGAALALSLLGLGAFGLGIVALGALGVLLALPALLLALLGGLGQPPTAGSPATPLLPPAPPPTPELVARPLATGMIFWLCVALLAGYALWTVLGRQAWAVAALARVRAGVLAPLAAWLRRLMGGAVGYARLVGGAVAERLRRPKPDTGAYATPLRRGHMSPAELVRLCYSALLRHAERLGQGRRPAETPYEYGARLGPSLPEAEEDLAHLTEAYLAAAYAPRPTTPAEARAARSLWARLRRRLQRPKGQG